MKEIGVGMMMRMAARGIKPRLIITEENGKWTLRSESAIKTVVCEFTPGVEFEETTPDGRQVTVKNTFDDLMTFTIESSLLLFSSQKFHSKEINGSMFQSIRTAKNRQLRVLSMKMVYI